MTRQEEVKAQSAMRVLRERADISQTQLAIMLHRAQPEISMWEWGKEKMPVTIKEKVFRILLRRLGDEGMHGCTPDDLDRPWDDLLMGRTRRVNVEDQAAQAG